MGTFRVQPGILDQMLCLPPGNTITDMRRCEDGTFMFVVMGKDMPQANSREQVLNNERWLVYETGPDGRVLKSWFMDPKHAG